MGPKITFHLIDEEGAIAVFENGIKVEGQGLNRLVEFLNQHEVQLLLNVRFENTPPLAEQ